jgi:hypothetical protein
MHIGEQAKARYAWIDSQSNVDEYFHSLYLLEANAISVCPRSNAKSENIPSTSPFLRHDLVHMYNLRYFGRLAKGFRGAQVMYIARDKH